MRRRTWLLSLVLPIALAIWIAGPYLTATAFILDLSGSRPWFRPLLPVREHPVTTRDLQIPTRFGPMAARLYEPIPAVGRSVLVLPGIHAGGVDEPRLDLFSRRLAGTGYTVVSAPLPELRQYRVTPRSTDMIEDAALWLADDATLAPGGRITLTGVSFAGGLALVAAGRPSLDGRLERVVAVGAHADLPRVMSFLCTGVVPDAGQRRPHDYGVAVILLAALPELVPPPQLEAARDTVLRFLDASSVDRSDPEQAAPMFQSARTLAETAREPSRSLLTLMNERNAAALGVRLTPYIESLGGDPALSPERSSATRAPVFLVHGLDDSVIPSSESTALAAYLRQHGNTKVQLLLTPLLSHADVRTPRLADAWRLIGFWKQVLD